MIQNERQKGHEIFSECISALVARNQFSPTYNAAPFNLKLDLIGFDIPGDVLAVERATILYNLCWFILKHYHSNGTRYSELYICISLPMHLIMIHADAYFTFLIFGFYQK